MIRLEKLPEFIESVNPVFRENFLRRLRLEVLEMIPELPISEEKKCYLTHQLTTAHTPEEISNLIISCVKYPDV